MNSDFVVEGVDCADGSRTVLHTFPSSYEAVDWMRRYVSKENAGNWDLIEVYDVRDPENAERIRFWRRD